MHMEARVYGKLRTNPFRMNAEASEKKEENEEGKNNNKQQQRQRHRILCVYVCVYVCQGERGMSE